MAVSAKMQILLVEDIVEVRKTVKEMLRKMGFKNVQDTGEADKGLKMIQEALEVDVPFDLVVVNFNMTPINGIDFYKKVQEMKHPKQNAKFILMTGSTEADVIKTAITTGIKNILVKPFSQQQLVEKLIQMFEKKAA